VTAGVHATRGDAIAIALAVVLVAALFAALWQPPEPAQAVEVRGTDGLVGRYGLERARTLAVPGPLGESEIRIADGAARFVASPCRNKVCVHRGWLRHGGDAAACLPNRVSLSLVGGGFDAISY
jgi:hypothetical protein